MEKDQSTLMTKSEDILSLRKTHLFLIAVLFFTTVIIFISYSEVGHQHHDVSFGLGLRKRVKANFTLEEYLIDTPKCKIPFVDPFVGEILKFYNLEDYMSCSKFGLLTYIEKRGNRVTLNVNKTLLSSYSWLKIFCCYSVVTRDVNLSAPDDQIKFSGCVWFTESVEIKASIIWVTCRNIFAMKVYSNVHAIIHLKDVPSNKSLVDPDSTLNVLLIGIDSISKLNMIRTMPKTFNFLKKNDFISLQGYTKIGLNTLPNVMGMLAGLNITQARQICDVDNFIDKCPLIWKKFKKRGYVTGYGEDSTSLGTFNYLKKGFSKPPTDFYFRPYMLATEKLPIVRRSNMAYCTGPEVSSERVMNLAKDFQTTLKEYKKFGLFWMNSFSHDGLNMPSAMDEKVEEFLDEILQHLNNTVLFFFSDHGFRFGQIRKTQTGWLEERIPFFYIHVPEIFKKRFPKKYSNLKANSERLTSGFDVYMTLQHILFLQDKKYLIKKSVSCPKCFSLFGEISKERTCEDAGIEKNWCVCNTPAFISPKERIVQEAGRFLVKRINEMIKTFPEGELCEQYDFYKIFYSGIYRFPNATNLLLRVKTRPVASFEGLIDVVSNVSETKFRLVNDVIRLNRYALYTSCIQNPKLERYCFCKEFFLID